MKTFIENFMQIFKPDDDAERGAENAKLALARGADPEALLAEWRQCQNGDAYDHAYAKVLRAAIFDRKEHLMFDRVTGLRRYESGSGDGSGYQKTVQNDG